MIVGRMEVYIGIIKGSLRIQEVCIQDPAQHL